MVVDVETSGLDPATHQAFEVAWWNLDTDEHACFIAPHNTRTLLAAADIEALKINRYIDRIPGEAADPDALRRLHQELQGNTLVGQNPAFDAAFLSKLFKMHTSRHATPWHYRLWDVSAYAAGVLGLKELPGLERLCEILTVDPPDHTSEGDVRATVMCIRILEKVILPQRMGWKAAA